ncbi:MAG: hypothetical protein CMO55_06640 [Verrucomicrobiales bacterium]|nr:hypothetical protein [Verrucomicrobiales bacterium]
MVSNTEAIPASCNLLMLNAIRMVFESICRSVGCLFWFVIDWFSVGYVFFRMGGETSATLSLLK